MSRALHGDPKTAQRDQLIRGMLELDGYTVIVVQARDLNDPQAVRQHLRNIAQAIGRTDLPVFTEATPTAPSPATAEVYQPTELEELLEYCDERCRDMVRSCADQSRPLPVVGYELQDAQGRVCAEAELAWPSKKVAVLLPEQDEAEAEFVAQGWKVFSTDGEQQKLLDALKE
jgi:DEAD/DEAH box helicase domain-containing protein